MREMKNSGIEWIKDIPTNWNISRLGGQYEHRNQKVSDKDYQALSVTKQGILLQLETVAKSDAHDDRKLVKKGDFVINSRSDRRGSCGISEYDGSVSLINTVLKPRTEMSPRYYNWLFHTMQFADEFYKWGHGIVDDLWTTRWQDMKKISIPFPPIDEQNKIANYLDKKCGEIDSISQDVQKQVEVLEEYKRSAIIEAVTHGLNPSAAMKDSGTVWLNKIPEHWTTKKGKYIFKIRNTKGNSINLELLSPTQKFGVIPQSKYEELSTQVTVKVNEQTNLMSFKTIHRGDYCISLRSFEGGFEYGDYEGVVSPAYTVFYPTVKVDRRYYKYLFKVKPFIAEMNSYSLSLRDGKPISFDDFGNTLIPIPPQAEQKEIADYLDKKCSEVDSIIADKKAQLETIEKYKKSLIYEYVTGKKEVINE